MLTAIKTTIIISIIVAFLSLMNWTQVSWNDFPEGFREAIQFATGTIRAIVEHVPFFEVPFNLILLGITIKFALVVWSWFMKIINMIKN